MLIQCVLFLTHDCRSLEAKICICYSLKSLSWGFAHMCLINISKWQDNKSIWPFQTKNRSLQRNGWKQPGELVSHTSVKPSQKKKKKQFQRRRQGDQLLTFSVQWWRDAGERLTPILGSKQHKVLNLGLAHLSVLGASLPDGKRPGALGQRWGWWRHLKRERLGWASVGLFCVSRVSQWSWGAPWAFLSALPWPWPPHPPAGSPALGPGS